MKINIDTVAKTISIDQRAKFSDILAALEGFFPNGGWKEYELVPTVTPHTIAISNEPRPWPQMYPRLTLCGTSGTSALVKGLPENTVISYTYQVHPVEP